MAERRTDPAGDGLRGGHRRDHPDLDAGVDLLALRDSMLARKEELMAQVEAGGLPPAELTVVKLQPA